MSSYLNHKLNIIILISGQGSTLQALIDSIAANTLNANIQAVISNKSTAYGLERARNANITTHVLPASPEISRESYDRQLAELILPYQPDLIILAGFLRILSAAFVNIFQHKIINIHPSLLPKYPGLDTYQRVLDAKDTYHGTTVHLVDEKLDGGPIIAQAKIAITPAETINTLSEKIHRLEHQLYPMVIQWFAEHRIEVQNNQLFLDHEPVPASGLQLKNII